MVLEIMIGARDWPEVRVQYIYIVSVSSEDLRGVRVPGWPARAAEDVRDVST